jgi:hypothetical protein
MKKRQSQGMIFLPPSRTRPWMKSQGEYHYSMHSPSFSMPTVHPVPPQDPCTPRARHRCGGGGLPRFRPGRCRSRDQSRGIAYSSSRRTRCGKGRCGTGRKDSGAGSAGGDATKGTGSGGVCGRSTGGGARGTGSAGGGSDSNSDSG